MRALAGEPEVSTTLRYKKKMMLWTFPSPSAPPGAPAAQHPGVVGYSLMTFVIRNGLQALRQVCHAWPSDGALYLRFTCCWKECMVLYICVLLASCLLLTLQTWLP